MAELNNNPGLFTRLTRLFNTDVIIRNVGGNQLKVTDVDRIQAYGNVKTNALIDRFTKLHRYGANMPYNPTMNYQTLRIQLYTDYEAMDTESIIASALDIIADESTLKNEFGDVIQIKTQNEKVKEVLENLFYDILNIEFNLWSWTRNMVKYGDFFLALEIAEGKGIINVTPYSVYNTERLEGTDPMNQNYVKFKVELDRFGKKEYENYEMAHFRLLSDTNFLPYGKAMIENGRRVWKQLSLMEDAMLIHRIMRAPEKRIFKVDVGNIPPAEVDNYMQKIINGSKKVPFLDQATGEYNLKYNIQNLIEDYYMPVRGSDNGTSIDTLKGLEYNMIDDINYLKGKMMAALKIPKAFLGYEEDISGKATLAAQDIRFAKTIERIQKVLVSELTKIAIVHLYAQGLDSEDELDFQLELTIPSKIYEQEKVELYTSKIALITQMQQTKMFSKKWMYDAIMDMTPEEQDELTVDVIEDTKQTFRLTSIETQGVDPAKETGTEEPTNVEEEIQKIKEELEEDGKVGRPKDPVRYGKDDHHLGRDPLGIKTLKQKAQRESKEIFKDMLGNKKTILMEDLHKK